MIGIIDYGAGNLGNVLRALEKLQYEARLLGTLSGLDSEVDFLVLPGVGAFPPAMAELSRRGWIQVLRDWGQAKNPLLGICLGMQLLYEASLEDGLTEGLGFFPGTVAPLEGLRKSPHMGWNRVSWLRELPGITDLFPGGLDAYFVHGLSCNTALGTPDFHRIMFNPAGLGIYLCKLLLCHADYLSVVAENNRS